MTKEGLLAELESMGDKELSVNMTKHKEVLKINRQNKE